MQFFLISQGATKLTREDIERVFSLYDRVSNFFIQFETSLGGGFYQMDNFTG